ncbi:MAG TPA: hypothetical protein VFL56_00645, partial [Solirubrobacterales bacterium]|nr:hypothetical protein [Solirubrobacterales bacterium]
VRARTLGAADTDDLPSAEAATVDAAVSDASEQSFQLGIGAAGVLMIVGGVIAGIGLRNPERETEYEPPGAVPAGECAHCPDHLTEEDVRERRAEPVSV